MRIYLKNCSLEDTRYLLREIERLSVYHRNFKEKVCKNFCYSLHGCVDTGFSLRITMSILRCQILRKNSGNLNFAHLFGKKFQARCHTLVDHFVDVDITVAIYRGDVDGMSG